MLRKLFSLVLSAAVAAALLAGCTVQTVKEEPPRPQPQGPSVQTPPAPESKGTRYPITVEDDAGRKVTVQAEPVRIVSVAPSTTEILFALGKGGSLVGRSDFDDFPAEVQQVPSIGGWYPAPNYEKIIAAKPDLLLMIGGSEPIREKLVNEFKITVFVVQPTNIGHLYHSIRNLGIVVNAQEQAEKVITDMQKAVKAVTDKTATVRTKPKVFYEVWHDPLMTAGNNTFMNDLIVLAGGVNSGGDVEGWANYSLERLQKSNPDVYVTSRGEADKVRARKGFEGLKAVRESRILAVDDGNLLVRPGPRLVLGLKLLAEYMHPDLFKQ